MYSRRATDASASPRAAWTRLLLCLLLALCMAPATGAETPQVFDFDTLGSTELYSGGQEGLVVLLADHPRLPQAKAIATALATGGRSAAIVDLDAYLTRIGPDCFDAPTLFDVYAQQVQQQLHFARFSAATLVGLGRGANFVRLLLATSRSGVFAAGVSAGDRAPLTLAAPPCGVDREQIGWRSASEPLALPTDLQPDSPWTETADSSPRAVLEALAGLLQRHAAKPDLPLIELPQSHADRQPWFAVVISGDGGWANIDKEIAEDLGSRGIAVVGWNALRYFWTTKTPERTGLDLARVLLYYQHAWGLSRVMLIGFSRGADVLPFMVSRLPADLRATVVGLVLLSPERTMDFQFHISDWFSHGERSSSLPIQAELQKLGKLPLLCVYGAEEADESLCTALEKRDGRHIEMLGRDHHFDGDYRTVTATILRTFAPAH